MIFIGFRFLLCHFHGFLRIIYCPQIHQRGSSFCIQDPFHPSLIGHNIVEKVVEISIISFDYEVSMNINFYKYRAMICHFNNFGHNFKISISRFPKIPTYQFPIQPPYLMDPWEVVNHVMNPKVGVDHQINNIHLNIDQGTREQSSGLEPTTFELNTNFWPTLSLNQKAGLLVSNTTVKVNGSTRGY